jgi:hypothetical protein
MTILQRWLRAGCPGNLYCGHPAYGPALVWRVQPAGRVGTTRTREAFQVIAVGVCFDVGGRRALVHEFARKRGGA